MAHNSPQNRAGTRQQDKRGGDDSKRTNKQKGDMTNKTNKTNKLDMSSFKNINMK